MIPHPTQETFIINDQPCTCPDCGARTQFLHEIQVDPLMEFHRCLNLKCEKEWVFEELVEEE